MKGNEGQKNIDGIIRRRTPSRTSVSSRSFVVPESESSQILQKKDTFSPSSISSAEQHNVFGDNKNLQKWYCHRVFWRILMAVIAVASLLIVLHRSHSVRIVVRPHFERIIITDTVSAYHHPESSQLGFDVMVVEESVTQEIIPTGVKEVFHYASGTVTLYNEYSTEPQRLLPETRLESMSGKTFVLGKEAVIIPGKTTEKPGEIQVVVYAEHPGESFNIDATDFTIPGFRELGLLDKYEKIYASSTHPFTGGALGTESYMSDLQQKDIELEVREQLLQLITQRIDYERTDEMFIFADDIVYHFPPATLVETVDGEYVFSASVQARIFFIHKNVITQYLDQQYITAQTPEQKLFSLESFEPRLVQKIHNFDTYPLQFSIYFDTQLVTQIQLNEESLIQSILSQNKNKVIQIVSQRDDIDIFDMRMKPFWRSSVPMSTQKIQLEQRW